MPQTNERLKEVRDRDREKYNKTVRDWRAKNPERALWMKVKSRAKKNGIPFDIEVSDIIIPEYCPVFGIRLEHNRSGKLGPCVTSPSLDRIDPKLGYIKGNVQVISHKANAAKSNLTLAQLEALVEYTRVSMKRLKETYGR
jgi:hypothetical protein